MWEERIVIDPKILVGKPVVNGTRLAVDFILDLLAQGWPHEEILRNYPGLEAEDIQACLAYARDTLRNEKVYLLKAACVIKGIVEVGGPARRYATACQ